ncbi:MAG: RagB/SusD family nutrient uptake outer membrane protein [Bacteroidota bacterium]
MKKILIIATILLTATTAMVISSCKKDITLSPLNGVTDYFKSYKDIAAALAGMYSSFQEETTGDGSGKDEGYGGRYHYWGEGRSDNFAPSQYFNTTITELSTNGVTINNTATDWNGLYRTISRANYIIKYAPGVPAIDVNTTPTIVNNALAQAYAMRAECYFYIVRLWGDAPLWTEPYQDITTQGARPRTSKTVLLDSIVRDLTKAYTLLPGKGTTANPVWTIHDAAICAIMADVYMWRKDYPNAIIWMNNLFKARTPNTTTATKYGGTTGIPDGSNLESIGNWKTNNFISPASGTTIEPIWSINWDNVSNGCACIPISIQTSNNPVRVDSTFYFNWKTITTDARLVQTLDITATPTSGLGKWDKVLKYYAATSGGGVTSTQATTYNVNLVMYRLGDMLLLYAEALNATGDRANALKYLNIIHTRAGLPPFLTTDPTIATADQLEDAILKERQYETFAEGKRWFDLVRMGRVNQVMDPILKGRQATKGSPQVGFGTDLNKTLWPISRAALNANTLLVQNPSY